MLNFYRFWVSRPAVAPTTSNPGTAFLVRHRRVNQSGGVTRFSPSVGTGLPATITPQSYMDPASHLRDEVLVSNDGGATWKLVPSSGVGAQSVPAFNPAWVTVTNSDNQASFPFETLDFGSFLGSNTPIQPFYVVNTGSGINSLSMNLVNPATNRVASEVSGMVEVSTTGVLSPNSNGQIDSSFNTSFLWSVNGFNTWLVPLATDQALKVQLRLTNFPSTGFQDSVLDFNVELVPNRRTFPIQNGVPWLPGTYIANPVLNLPSTISFTNSTPGQLGIGPFLMNVQGLAVLNPATATRPVVNGTCVVLVNTNGVISYQLATTPVPTNANILARYVATNGVLSSFQPVAQPNPVWVNRLPFTGNTEYGVFVRQNGSISVLATSGEWSGVTLFSRTGEAIFTNTGLVWVRVTGSPSVGSYLQPGSSGFGVVSGSATSVRVQAVQGDYALCSISPWLASGGSGGSGASILDTAYGPGWNGDTTNGASRNAIFDVLETLAPRQSPSFTGTISGASASLTGSISGASLTVTGNLSGGSISGNNLTISGNSTLGPVSSSGAISGQSVTATGAISGQSVTATGNLTGNAAILTGGLSSESVSTTTLAVDGNGSVAGGLTVVGTSTLTGVRASNVTIGSVPSQVTISGGTVTTPNLSVTNTLTVPSLSVSGPISGTSGTISGNLQTNTISVTGLSSLADTTITSLTVGTSPNSVSILAGEVTANDITTGAITISGSMSADNGTILTLESDSLFSGNITADQITTPLIMVTGSPGQNISLAGGSVTASGNLTISGTSNLTGLVTAGSLTSTGTFTQGTSPNHATISSGNLSARSGTFTGALSGTSLALSGALTGTTLTLTGNLSGNTLGMSGAISGQSVTATGALSGGSASISGNTQTQTLTSTGAANLASLSVSGSSTLAGISAGSLTLTGNGSIQGTLGVTGQTSLGNLTGASGTFTGNLQTNTLTSTGNGSIQGSLTIGTGPNTIQAVSGGLTLTGGLTASSGTISGNTQTNTLTSTGNTTVQGNLNVGTGGNIISLIAGALTVPGLFTAQGGSSVPDSTTGDNTNRIANTRFVQTATNFPRLRDIGIFKRSNFTTTSNALTTISTGTRLFDPGNLVSASGIYQAPVTGTYIVLAQVSLLAGTTARYIYLEMNQLGSAVAAGYQGNTLLTFNGNGFFSFFDVLTLSQNSLNQFAVLQDNTGATTRNMDVLWMIARIA